MIQTNAEVDIRAGQRIHFKPGFQPYNGEKQHAFIQPYPDGCPNILRHSQTQQQPTLAQQAQTNLLKNC